MDDQDLKSARRGRPGSVVALSVAGVVILAVGVLVGSRLGPVLSPSQAADRASTTTTTADLPVGAPSTEVQPTAAPPNATWLADLTPVASSSIDNTYVASPWTIAAARVRGAVHGKAISATGAWCSSAQLIFALDGKYDRFSARVAIADNSLDTKELDFYVLADDKRVAEIPNTGTTARTVDVSVAGAVRLAIGVERTSADPSPCPGPQRVGVWVDPSLTAAGSSAPPS